MIVDRYFYGRLPENEKQVYREIYQSCMAHKDMIQLSAPEPTVSKALPRIIQALMDDNPLLYYLNQSAIDIATDSNGNIAVMPQYFFSEKTVGIYNQRIQDTANKIIYDLNLTEGSEESKIRKVHDYMCRNVTYDYGGADTKAVSRFIAAHNIIGVFAHKKAQCDGISKAVKVLLNAVDVRCMVAFGQAKDENGAITDHSWNIVNIGGTPYHMDVTFDIGAGSAMEISYDYYNVTDSQMRKDHVFSTGFPKCTEKKDNYFEQQGLVFSSKRRLQEYITKRIKKNDRSFYFKLAGKLKAGEIADEVVAYIPGILKDTDTESFKMRWKVNGFANTCRITII